MEHAAKDPRMPFTVEKVSIDPRNANITVEYSVPNVGGVTDTKRGLLYAGYRLIWSAMSQSPATQVYTLRGNAYAEGDKQPSLALIADISPTLADQARGASDYVTASSSSAIPGGELTWRMHRCNHF